MSAPAGPVVGALLPEAPKTLADVAPLAERLQEVGATRIWTGESTVSAPCLLLAAAALDAGLATGTCVALTPLQHPLAAAREARTIAALTGHEHVAGFGPGSPDAARALAGTAPGAPVRASARYVSTVRALLDGEPVVRDDDDLRCSVALAPAPSPRVEVGLGVLRPAMARAAGRVADVALTWLAPASYLHEVLGPALAEGHAERERPGRCRVAAVVHVVVSRPGRSLAEGVRAATTTHLQAPHYRDLLVRAGVEVSSRRWWHSVVDRGVVLAGPADEVAERARELWRAGCSELVLDAVGVHRTAGPSAARDDVAELSALLRTTAREGAGGGPAPSTVAGPPLPG